MPKQRIQVPTQCAWCLTYWLRRKGQKGDPCCSFTCRANIKAYRKGRVTSPWPKPSAAKSCRVHFNYCSVCWQLFATRNGLQRCCSDKCRQNTHDIGTRRIYYKTCQNCGKLATMRSWNSKRCKPCQILFEWECKKAYNQARNHRKVGQLIPYIGQRDNWRCSICHRKVKSHEYNKRDIWSPTIDHVIPVAQGGTDDLANLKLAHMICNAKKGKYGGNEQLLLVG
jgi:hypothetical protein